MGGRMKTRIVGLLLVLASATLVVWGACAIFAPDGKQDEARKLEQVYHRQLGELNRAWLKRYAAVRDSALEDTSRAAVHAEKAETVTVEIEREPAPQRGTVTDSALAAFWERRAEQYRRVASEWRLAYENEKRATGRLLAAGDTSAARLDGTTIGLDKEIEAQDDRGKFSLGLGIRVPKPPKWVAAAAGCLLGGATGFAVSRPPRPDVPNDRSRNTALGCAAGAAVVTTVTPTD